MWVYELRLADAHRSHRQVKPWRLRHLNAHTSSPLRRQLGELLKTDRDDPRVRHQLVRYRQSRGEYRNLPDDKTGHVWAVFVWLRPGGSLEHPSLADQQIAELMHVPAESTDEMQALEGFLKVLHRANPVDEVPSRPIVAVDAGDKDSVVVINEQSKVVS